MTRPGLLVALVVVGCATDRWPAVPMLGEPRVDSATGDTSQDTSGAQVTADWDRGSEGESSPGTPGASLDRYLPADAVLRLYNDTPFGPTGYTAVSLDDIDGDAAADVVSSIGYFAMASPGSAGAVFIHSGLLTGDVAHGSAQAVILPGSSGYHIQRALAVGDATGDGLGDLLVLTIGATDDSPTEGATYLVSGPLPEGVMGLDELPATVVTGAPTPAYGLAYPAINAINDLGDLNGDALSDYSISARQEPVSALGCVNRLDSTCGPVVHVMLSPHAGGFVEGVSSAVLLGFPEGFLIHSVAGGDIDGDGASDVVVAEDADPSQAWFAGAYTVVHGPVNGTHELFYLDARRLGEGQDDGLARVAIGDVDADGYDDVLSGADEIGIGFPSGPGKAYLTHGPISGVMTVDQDAAAKLIGMQTPAYLGAGVELTDLDQDGHDDLVVSSHWGGSGGVVHVVYGPAAGTLQMEAGADLTIWGPTGSAAGITLDAGGDANGDGYPDILIGDSGNDHLGNDVGAIFLLLGGL